MTDQIPASNGPDWFKSPPPRRFGALALLERADGEFAIICRSYWTAISRWGMPGGAVAADEAPRRALSLHIDAKLGLRVTPGRMLAADFTPEMDGNPEGVNFVYHATIPAGAEPVAAGGYTDVRFGSLDQLCDLAIDHERTRLERAVEALNCGGFYELLRGTPLHPIAAPRSVARTDR